MNFAIVFPGQGSQSVGMLGTLAAEHASVVETFAEASEVLQRDLWQLVTQGPKEELDRTENTQPAMLAAGVAVWRVWNERSGPRASWMAGHSLGELTALVCAGAMDYRDAVGVVAARGRFMQEAVPAGSGAMAAILGLSDDEVREVCVASAGDQVVEAVNFNSPGQVVIAGNADAVGRAVEAAKAAGAKRALPLPVSVPSHCALMRPAAERFGPELARIAIRKPEIPVLHNVTAEPAQDGDQIRDLLVRQLYNPVRWVGIVRRLKDEGAGTLIEAGPGKVLAGLAKRIDKELESLAVFDPAGLAAALEVARNA
jgi:[acyl-carrier-protein] S-malonyltransferase